jgi:hypothetical protein
MKNIKTFVQLFESSPNQDHLKIASFGKNEFVEFQNYYNMNPIANWATNWGSLASNNNESFFKKSCEENLKFYIINHIFLLLCDVESFDNIKIIKAIDINNRRIDYLDKTQYGVTDMISKEIGCSGEVLRIGLAIANKTSKFSIDLNNIQSMDKIDFLCNYFKKHPLEIYALDDYQQLKKEVLNKTGISDYSNIGRKLRSGLI